MFTSVKNIIIQHKNEIESINLASLVRRDRIDVSKKILNDNIVKVITGPRRAGKSTYCVLLLENISFGYVNFDDDLLFQIENSDEIITAIAEVYADPEILFFDEIQNLKNWELFINKWHRRGKNIILTGSNSKLLSKELSSHLTGRHIPVTLYPLSFREFLKAEKFLPGKSDLAMPDVKGKIKKYLQHFINTGGYPEVVLKKMDNKAYLNALFDSILMKDIAKRYSVKFIQKLYDLALFLIGNTGKEFSFSKIRKTLFFNSTVTLQNYIMYLEETYLIYLLNRFSAKLREQINTPKKIFAIDNGFIKTKGFHISEGQGQLMENFIFTELLKKNYVPNVSLFYYKTRNQREVDFLLKEGIRIKVLIQVVYDFSMLQTQEREISALVEASEELRCSNLQIITWEEERNINVSGKKIQIIPLWKWLLN